MQKAQGKKGLISVIIPIYKVLPYLERCVESVRRQTYSDLEIILVDDGSPDGCGEICDHYASCDKRIKVIHKVNGGLSDARNAALDICMGEWISFVDSDDWISPYYVENLYKAVLEAGTDMAASWYETIFAEQETISIPKKEPQEMCVLDAESCLRKLLYQDGVDTTATGKLYARYIMEELRYPVGRLYEDIMVTVRAIHRSKRIVVISNIDYYYFQRNTSIQYESYSHRKLDAVMYMEELKCFVEKEYPQLEQAACCRYLSAVCNILFQIDKPENFREDFEYLWQQVKEKRRIVLRDRSARKKARIAAALSYLGYPLLRAVYIHTQERAIKM